MASILRSGKFVRYFSGIARNLVFNSSKETEGNFVHHSPKLGAALSHGFASAVPKSADKGLELERSLKRLDQDVRRTGRISRRDIEEVLEEIRLHRSPTSSQSLLVIRCCGNLVPEELPEIRTALVQEIWKTLNNLNVAMDVSHYNALLRVYLENEHSFSPTEFLADLEAKGIEPNRVTYQRLISRYCQQGDIEGATRILEFMREKQLPINEHVFNALIMGHSQAEDLESSLGIIAVMKQAGLEPTSDTYTTLLCSYAKVGDIKSILATLDACEKNELYLLDKDIFDVIYTLSTNGHSAHVAQLLPRLRRSSGYNQDAFNLILRLTNKGHESIAFDVLKTMTRGARSDGEPTDTGTFFIKQLVRARRPVDSIRRICAELQETGLNTKALLIAVEASVASGSTEMALPFLKELQASGQPIRQHYFWPLICTQGRMTGRSADVLEVLARMQSEFGLVASGETIRDYVIPNLKEKKSDQIIGLLRANGVSASTAVTSTVYHLLVQNNLREAANVATSYTIYYQPGLYRRPLVQALIRNGDTESFVRFVRQVYEGIPRLEQLRQKNGNGQEQQQQQPAVAEVEADVVVDVEMNGEGAGNSNQADLLGLVCLDVVSLFRKNRAETLTELLRGFVQQGLSITNGHAEKIQERLGSELTTEISQLLGQLAAGDLEPVAVDKSNARPQGFAQLPIDQLERLIAQNEAKGENSNGLKRFLLSALFRSKDLAKTESTVERLSAEGFVMTGGIYAQLIDLFTHHEQADKALAAHAKIRTIEPDFRLDNLKVIRLVSLLTKTGRIDEAVQLIESYRRTETDADVLNFNYNTTCWRLLNQLADQGSAADLQRIYDTLKSCHFIEPNNVLLGPLVKVHLVNNDCQQAVDVFERISVAHNCTPWKNDLACRLIQAEDATNLQRLTDLSTNIHGEVNSLYDLVFSFVECGRIRQARKILETPGLRSRPQKINVACERYQQEGKVTPLEGLVEATKDLNHIDRGDIYYNLLLSYCKDNQPEKALGLWTKMQEEDIQPSDQFLIKLGKFLRANNFEVPFVVPSEAKDTSAPAGQKKKNKSEAEPAAGAQPKTARQPKQAPVATPPTPLGTLKKAIRSGSDVDQMLAAKKQLATGDRLSITEQSLFIEKLLLADRLGEASKAAAEMLAEGAYPIPRIFRFYLNKLALAGDTSELLRIAPLIGTETKKVVSFDNRLCHAYVESGKAEQYLDLLEAELDAAKTDAERQVLADKFPRGGAIGILSKHPELVEKYEKLAEKYAAHQMCAPMNVLWMHHFIAGNDDKAQRVWTQHASKSPRPMFQRIVQVAREQQDEPLVRKLIAVLKTGEQVTAGGLGIAYSCLIDVQVAKQNFDGGLVSINEALATVPIENINRTALQRVSDGLQAAGKSFPHAIPERQVKGGGDSAAFVDGTSSSSSSSESSSSDDEPAKGTPNRK